MPRFDTPGDLNNRLLLALPPETLKRVWPSLRAVNTTRGEVIDHETAPIKHMYFLNRGLVSLVKTMRDGRSVEIGAIGIEGITDPTALFGIETAALETVVQIPGKAFRIERSRLRQEMANDDALREIMESYTRFAFRKVAQTSACNRLHSLEERCCRWLLIAHDSALAGSFPLTHEFLAMMLGVQRSGVSIVANLLKKAGLIEYTRGRVTIMDRSGLEEAACECYGVIRDELDDLFGPPRKRSLPA
jgi:CRP-like cAMP-binding protein